MALPPIISNSPIARLLTGANPAQKQDETKAEQPRSATPRDTVSISDAALEKLTEVQARQKSEDVRDILVQNPETTLTNNPESLT